MPTAYQLGQAFAKAARLRPEVALQPHQKRVSRRLTALEAAGEPAAVLVYHGLGSGKSLASIAAAQKANEPTLVVAPASLRPNYRRELDKFVDPGTGPDVDVQSYTRAARGDLEPRSTVVFDEFHRARNPQTALAASVQDLASQADRALLLTGSPVVNDPGDFAAAYSILTGRKMSPDAFRDRFVRLQAEQPGLFARIFGARPKPVGLKAEDELERDLTGHVDYYAPAKAPADVKTEDVPVEMSPEQAKAYDAMYGRVPWLLRWKLERQYELTPSEARRLRSFLTGPRQAGLSLLPFQRRPDPLQAFESSAKLQTAMRRLRSVLRNPDAKALVFSNYIDAGLEPYQAALAKAGIPAAVFSGRLSDQERQQLVDNYNTNKLRVALLGPSGTEGLSFKGTRLVQQLDPYWNPVRPQQSVGRAVRFDSHVQLPPGERNVLVERYLARLPGQPAPWWKRIFGAKPGPAQPAADDYLAATAARKEKVNQALLQLLQRVGQQRVGEGLS